MTKINKLEMKGFKSFAKRSELIFGDNFNCVIGPNGSGKSNILDALCFVLGKKLKKSFEKLPSLAPISIKLVSSLLSIKQRILIKSSYVDGDLKINFL